MMSNSRYNQLSNQSTHYESTINPLVNVPDRRPNYSMAVPFKSNREDLNLPSIVSPHRGSETPSKARMEGSSLNIIDNRLRLLEDDVILLKNRYGEFDNNQRT